MIIFMKVAVAQINITDIKEDNLKKILAYIQKAKDSDVVCFPELSLQPNLDNILPIQKDLIKISESAIKNDINIIFGSYIRYKGKIKNRIFVVDRKGFIIHRYDKKHPYISEVNQVSKGRINKLFNLDGVTCAVINCWDYAFPEYGRDLAKNGAKIIFCPSYLMSHPRTVNVLERIPQVRAFDYMSYFIMVDAVAEDTFKRSKICHPLRLLHSIKDREGIIKAYLDVSEIDKLRHEFKNFQNNY